MAKNPTSKPTPKSSQKQPRLVPRYDPQRGSAPPEMIPLVEMAWVFKALAGVFLLAFLCAYASICILFARGQWQLVLHPSHTVATTPASVQLPFTDVHFGVDASGQPQLNGWWIPASTPTPRTALVLHSADGNIANALPAAQLLHAQNLNVFLFDYRGYGQSLNQDQTPHPTEATMESDATTALTYLTNTRNIPTSAIAIYGNGLGASIAVHLCAQNPALPALILQSPDGDLATRISQDPSAKLVPFHLLFNEPFPLTTPLSKLQTPHLILPTHANPANLTQFLTTHLPSNP